jgi:hypothetical protein
MATLFVESFEALSKQITSGESMLLAMTCRTLYMHILNDAQLRIKHYAQMPLTTDLYYMWCPHGCCASKTAFVTHKSSSKTRTLMQCTHCLYQLRVRTTGMPNSVEWLHPEHSVQVKYVLSQAGSRHSLLVPNAECS